MRSQRDHPRSQDHTTPDPRSGWLPANWRCDPLESSMQQFGDLLSDDIFSRLAPNITGKTPEEFRDALTFGSFQICMIDGRLTGFWKGDPGTICDLGPIFKAIAMEVAKACGRSAEEISGDAQSRLFEGKLPLSSLKYSKTTEDCVHLRSLHGQSNWLSEPGE